MASAATVQKALGALDGMREVVRHEMLGTGFYVSTHVVDPKLKQSGAICGGRKHCAIGSLWVGAGVKYVRDEFGAVDLPGVAGHEREDFVRNRPGLRMAYEAINEAARHFAKRRGIELSGRSGFDDIEDLFEGYYGDRLTKRDMLNIITAAKRKVTKKAKRDGR